MTMLSIFCEIQHCDAIRLKRQQTENLISILCSHSNGKPFFIRYFFCCCFFFCNSCVFASCIFFQVFIYLCVRCIQNNLLVSFHTFFFFCLESAILSFMFWFGIFIYIDNICLLCKFCVPLSQSMLKVVWMQWLHFVNARNIRTGQSTLL